MKFLMPESIAKRLALNLHAMRLSEFPVSIFDFSTENESCSKERQQFAVDMLYRCWKCSLVEVFHDVVSESLRIQGVDEFVGRLSRVRMFEDVLSEQGVIWHAPQFETTPNGVALLDRCFSREVDVDDPARVLNFNVEVCDIFAENGVPWQKKVLFPLNLCE